MLIATGGGEKSIDCTSINVKTLFQAYALKEDFSTPDGCKHMDATTLLDLGSIAAGARAAGLRLEVGYDEQKITIEQNATFKHYKDIFFEKYKEKFPETVHPSKLNLPEPKLPPSIKNHILHKLDAKIKHIDGAKGYVRDRDKTKIDALNELKDIINNSDNIEFSKIQKDINKWLERNEKTIEKQRALYSTFKTKVSGTKELIDEIKTNYKLGN